MLRHLTILAVLVMGCASVPPQPMPRPVPEVVLWSFIPAFTQDDAPCVVLRPEGRVIARTGCRGSYAEFEPREEVLYRLVAALTSPALEALEAEYYVAESTDTAENTLQWARSGCRRQVVVDGWLGNGQELGYPVDRGKTPGPFLAAYEALLSLRPRSETRPYLPRLWSSYSSRTGTCSTPPALRFLHDGQPRNASLPTPTMP